MSTLHGPDFHESDGPVEVSRLMLPDDANPAGNVHGGCILKLIEQAGTISATKHCNSDPDSAEQFMARIARIEQVDFLFPMHIGDVAKLQARVTFASRRSMSVTVTVWAEDVMTGTKRVTNRANLWYVAYRVKGEGETPVPVPPLHPRSPLEKKLYEEGRRLYETSKRKREECRIERMEVLTIEREIEDGKGQHHSQEIGKKLQELRKRQSGTLPAKNSKEHIAILNSLILPSDCNITGLVQGGHIMKLMDNAAGIVAWRHCHTNVVTARIEALNFEGPMYNGNIAKITARLAFVSQRSMDIEVNVDAEDIYTGKTQRVNNARFIFVSLGAEPDGSIRSLPVPQLELETLADVRRFEQGLQRYEERRGANVSTEKGKNKGEKRETQEGGETPRSRL